MRVFTGLSTTVTLLIDCKPRISPQGSVEENLLSSHLAEKYQTPLKFEVVLELLKMLDTSNTALKKEQTPECFSTLPVHF